MQENTPSKGQLVVVAAPSGAGKGTLLQRVRERLPNSVVTVSATTRPPRPGETHGVEYYFYAPDAFDRLIEEAAFVEWAHVHGRRYGTLKSEIERLLKEDAIVILEVDVQGMRNIKQLYPQTIAIFIMPPSMAELERRLVLRGVNTPEDMAIRLKNAETELEARHEFDYIVVNDRIERATDELIALIQGDKIEADTEIP